MANKVSEADLHWLVRPSTIRKLWIWGIIMLALIALSDLLLTPHPHFGADGYFGFYSAYGLMTCVAMVIGAKALGIFLKRKDTYYDD
jgi:hypothetical protein